MCASLPPIRREHLLWAMDAVFRCADPSSNREPMPIMRLARRGLSTGLPLGARHSSDASSHAPAKEHDAPLEWRAPSGRSVAIEDRHPSRGRLDAELVAGADELGRAALLEAVDHRQVGEG